MLHVTWKKPEHIMLSEVSHYERPKTVGCHLNKRPTRVKIHRDKVELWWPGAKGTKLLFNGIISGWENKKFF